MQRDDSENIIEEIKKRIHEHFEVIELNVTGSAGHYTIRLMSPDFEGKSSVSQQRMVFQALGDLILGASAPIHAIDRMETLLPD